MKNKLFSAFLSLILVFTVIFLLMPLLLLIIRGADFIFPSLMSEEVLFSLKMSLKTATISTVICMILSIPASYALFKYPPKYKGVIENIIYTPMSLPHLVSGVALLLLFGRNGIGDFLYNTFNIDFVFTVSGIVLAQVFINLSFSINITLTALDEIDRKMIFTARTLGCSEFQAFFYIILPALKRNILSNIIMTWSRALGEFGAVMMVAGTTRLKTEVLPTSIFLNMSTGDLDLAIGTASILIILSLACMLIFNSLLSPKRRA